MAKNLNHREWINQQFDKYLYKSHRNCFIHSSLIEGTLIKESEEDKFALANKFLLCSGKISASEFCVFDEIRKIRNRLAHEILKESFSQNDMDKLLKDLIDKIHEAYRISKFLDNKLFRKYHIARLPVIKFKIKE